jgi:hypothetical protein
MRKFFGALAVVSVLAISIPVQAAPQSADGGTGIIHQILAKLRNCVVRVLDEVGTPKP